MDYMTEDEWRYICKKYGNNTQDEMADEYDKIVKQDDLLFNLNLVSLIGVLVLIVLLFKVLQ